MPTASTRARVVIVVPGECVMMMTKRTFWMLLGLLVAMFFVGMLADQVLVRMLR